MINVRIMYNSNIGWNDHVIYIVKLYTYIIFLHQFTPRFNKFAAYVVLIIFLWYKWKVFLFGFLYICKLSKIDKLLNKILVKCDLYLWYVDRFNIINCWNWVTSGQKKKCAVFIELIENISLTNYLKNSLRKLDLFL